MEGSTYKLKINQKIYFWLKSIMDFFVALTALSVLLPIFLVIAIAIKIDSPGPVFFVQKRIGKDGKLFNCIKFRSMSVNARHDVAGYEYKDASSHVTKVGAFLRKSSLDELPQLINILTLRMSLIGFRPSQSCEHELNNAREGYDVYQIRPGITGWAQVNGRDILASNPKKKAEYDAYYLEHFSLFLDVKIFFMTIKKVLIGSDVKEGIIETNTVSVTEYSETLIETVCDQAEESEETLDIKEEPLTN